MEGLPVVLMEAMSMGRPVVATAITGVPELVEDELSGLLVRPGRADLLADALERLARDPGFRAGCRSEATSAYGQISTCPPLRPNSNPCSRLRAPPREYGLINPALHD